MRKRRLCLRLFSFASCFFGFASFLGYLRLALATGFFALAAGLGATLAAGLVAALAAGLAGGLAAGFFLLSLEVFPKIAS